MIVIGHSAIAHSAFIKIESIQDIKHSSAKDVLWFDTNALKSAVAFDIATHCKSNELSYAIKVHNIEQLVLFSNLAPTFIIAEIKYAKAFQHIIEHYLLDCKLLCIIESSKAIEKMALLGVDGVIFRQVLEKI